ncbi:hypothetical protein AB0K51_15050 [Kitasatospora sp. NPDC049285]|uniref:hypothetical protein n=1 Tax=Kitasatospora sp. NPDC049285 TaxID=3157096 RepID=UPI00341F2E72
MARKPSIAEIGAYLARVRAGGDAGPLLADKADLLERIASNNPHDSDMAEVARDARRAADEHQRRSR